MDRQIGLYTEIPRQKGKQADQTGLTSQVGSNKGLQTERPRQIHRQKIGLVRYAHLDRIHIVCEKQYKEINQEGAYLAEEWFVSNVVTSEF